MPPSDPKVPTATPTDTTLFGESPREAQGSATTLVSTPFTQVDPVPPADAGHGSRYETRQVLGEGGMGEVRLCKDALIGRDVALKAIKPGFGSRSDLRRRFVREARVQGQLEHPSIVPVYDLSLQPEPAFFTMKRVRGVTLEHVIERLREKDEGIAVRFSRRKLLTAFASVCLTVDYAHAHGVVHRDLKPANVMLGDFGEVYVLDWGIAKVGSAPDLGDGESIDAASDATAKTEAGALMGTLGYSAPEQIRGATVDARSDVYALGAILFELLTLEPLHTGKRANDIVTTTLGGANARASQRSPDREVPPELEALCVKATHVEPDRRYASARELHDAVEGFLDGDRDLEMRRSFAEKHARAASLAAGRALAPDNDEAEAERRVALREAGRALALDPSCEEALQTTLRLRMQQPRELPKEVREQIEAARWEAIKSVGRVGVWVYATGLLYVPLLFWMGVRDPLLLALGLGCYLAGWLVTIAGHKHPSSGYMVIVSMLSSLAFATLSRTLGPFVLLPVIIATNTTAFAMDVSKWRRWLATASGCLAILVPALLEWTHVIEPSYVFAGGVMTIVPHMVSFPATPTLALLLCITVGTVLTSSLLLGRTRLELDDAHRRLFWQAWQLRQLAPDAHEPSALAPVVG